MTFNVGDKVYTKDLPNKTLVISEIYINEGNPFDGYKFANFEGKDFTELVHNLEHVVKAPVPEAPAIRTEYVVVENVNKKIFISDVEELLSRGYTPLNFSFSMGCYFQAMAISREIDKHLPAETK